MSDAVISTAAGHLSDRARRINNMLNTLKKWPLNQIKYGVIPVTYLMYFALRSANEEEVVDHFMEVKRCPTGYKEDTTNTHMSGTVTDTGQMYIIYNVLMKYIFFFGPPQSNVKLMLFDFW